MLTSMFPTLPDKNIIKLLVKTHKIANSKAQIKLKSIMLKILKPFIFIKTSFLSYHILNFLKIKKTYFQNSLLSMSPLNILQIDKTFNKF